MTTYIFSAPVITSAGWGKVGGWGAPGIILNY